MIQSNRYLQRRKLMGDINVVPYIDVMLVLLVIFMITTPLLKQGVNVNLPQSSSKTLTNQHVSPIIISIDKSGHYYLNISTTPNTPLSTNTLVRQVSTKVTTARKLGHKQAVYVQGDKNAYYGKVVKIMALLQHAGINNVGLITENPVNKNHRR